MWGKILLQQEVSLEFFFLLHLSEPEETTRHGELQFALQ